MPAPAKEPPERPHWTHPDGVESSTSEIARGMAGTCPGRASCVCGLIHHQRGQRAVEPARQETGVFTGTKDKDYNLIWFVEQCLSNSLRLETYIADAERAGDTELADFFRRAQGESRKGAEQGKEHLRKRLS
jgi:hypothetical protein